MAIDIGTLPWVERHVWQDACAVQRLQPGRGGRKSQLRFPVGVECNQQHPQITAGAGICHVFCIGAT